MSRRGYQPKLLVGISSGFFHPTEAADVTKRSYCTFAIVAWIRQQAERHSGALADRGTQQAHGRSHATALT